MKLTAKLKTAIIKEIVEEGAKVADICYRYDLNKETVNQLRSVFELHGHEGIQRKRKYSYKREFKLEVVRYAKDSHDSMRSVSIKYNLPKSTVRDWVIEYDRHGEGSFTEERRERKLSDSKPRGRRQGEPEAETVEHAELQRLRKRNRYLEMENEYLKKLDALVRERVLRERRRQWTSWKG